MIAAVGCSDRPARRRIFLTSAVWIWANTFWRTQRWKKSKTLRGGGNGSGSERHLPPLSAR